MGRQPEIILAFPMMLEMKVPQKQGFVFYKVYRPSKQLRHQETQDQVNRKPNPQPLASQRRLKDGIKRLEQNHHHHRRGGEAQIPTESLLVAIPALQELPISKFIDQQPAQQK